MFFTITVTSGDRACSVLFDGKFGPLTNVKVVVYC